MGAEGILDIWCELDLQSLRPQRNIITLSSAWAGAEDDLNAGG